MPETRARPGRSAWERVGTRRSGSVPFRTGSCASGSTHRTFNAEVGGFETLSAHDRLLIQTLDLRPHRPNAVLVSRGAVLKAAVMSPAVVVTCTRASPSS